MTPSLPTLSMASAIISPIAGCPAAEMAATWAICSLVSTSRALASSSVVERGSTALSMPRLSADGVGAGRDVAQALLDHRLGEDRGGRRAVTGDVVGLGGDLLGQLAPRFS
jgi:hypothetical protein